MGYIGSRPKKMQPVKVAAYQKRQYIIFSLNVGNGDTTEQALQGPEDRRSSETHYCGRISTRTTLRGAQSYEGIATIPSQ